MYINSESVNIGREYRSSLDNLGVVSPLATPRTPRTPHAGESSAAEITPRSLSRMFYCFEPTVPLLNLSASYFGHFGHPLECQNSCL